MTKQNNRPIKNTKKWDDRYLDMAKLVGSWSKDPRAKVGAAIVNPRRGRLISIGFNGFPSNVEDDVQRLNDADTKLTMTIHAEQNALIFAGQQAFDCDAYVVGKPVCSMCATLLIQAGVRRVIAAKPLENTGSKWHTNGLIALKMFHEAGVLFQELTDKALIKLELINEKPHEALAPAGIVSKDEEVEQAQVLSRMT